MSQCHYLGRQPILDSSGSVCTYEMLYRGDRQSSAFSDHRFATASVLAGVMNRLGLKNIVGSNPAFIKVSADFLMHDMIFSIPSEFFIFSILEDVQITERIIERIEMLKAKGYRLAINDSAASDEELERLRPILFHMDYFKLDTASSDKTKLPDIVAFLKPYTLQIIATKVESHASYERLSRYGIRLFQGYYFAKPKVLESEGIDPEQFGVIRLYNMLMSDVNIDEITTAFEQNHAVTMQLLQFINSGAFHFTKRIASIHHVLTLVGRNPLAQWLMLMIYAKSVNKDSTPSALVLTVKNRTETMMNLLRLVKPDARSNLLGSAYFVGVLSLMDTVMQVPLTTLLEEIHIDESVKKALLEKSGLLGELYALILEVERFNTHAIEAFMAKYNLPVNALDALFAETIENVNAFESSLKQGSCISA